MTTTGVRINAAASTPLSGKEAEATPKEALRRLDLNGLAGRQYSDVLNLDATDLGTAARQLNTEREHLEQDYAYAAQGIDALKKVGESLEELSNLVNANAKPGVSAQVRRDNQKQIDILLTTIGETLNNAAAGSNKALDGSKMLHAGNFSLQINEVSLQTLGKSTGRGRSVSLEDLGTRKLLDTSRGKRTAQRIAQKSIDSAVKAIEAMQKELAAFQSDRIRPRIGDVATTLEGLFSTKYETLTSSSAAVATAVQIRTLTLSSASVAASVGADGWDKARVFALVK